MQAVREIRRIEHAQVTFELSQAFWGQLVEIIILPLQPDVTDSTHNESLAEARELMRTFGRGLGAGQAPHDAAQRHDDYLYARRRL